MESQSVGAWSLIDSVEHGHGHVVGVGFERGEDVGADVIDTLRGDRGKCVQTVGAAVGEFLACDLVASCVSWGTKPKLCATERAMFCKLSIERNSRRVDEALDGAWHAYWHKPSREKRLLCIPLPLNHRGRSRAVVYASACSLGLYEVLANRRPEIRIAFLEEGSHKLGMHAGSKRRICLIVYSREIGDVPPPEASPA